MNGSVQRDFGYVHPFTPGVVLPNTYRPTDWVRQQQLQDEGQTWTNALVALRSSYQLERLRHVMQMYREKGATTRLDHCEQTADFAGQVSRLTNALAGTRLVSEVLAYASGLSHDIGHPVFGHDGEEGLSQVLAAAGLARPTYCHNAEFSSMLSAARYNVGIAVVGRPRLRLPSLMIEMGSLHSWGTREGWILEHNLVKLADRIAHTTDDLIQGLNNGFVPKRYATFVRDAWREHGGSSKVLPTSQQLRSIFIEPAASVIVDHGVVGLPVDVAELLYSMREVLDGHVLGTPERRSYQAGVHRLVSDLVTVASDDLDTQRQAHISGREIVEVAAERIAGLNDAQAFAVARQFGLARPPQLTASSLSLAG